MAAGLRAGQQQAWPRAAAGLGAQAQRAAAAGLGAQAQRGGGLRGGLRGGLPGRTQRRLA